MTQPHGERRYRLRLLSGWIRIDCRPEKSSWHPLERSRLLFPCNATNYSLFAQDTWKSDAVKLTLTYGLRWEINTPPVSATSGQPLYVMQGIFDSNPLAMVPGAFWHTRFDDFAPRFGAAYQITPKTVLRGGFGFFYDLGYGASASLPLRLPVLPREVIPPGCLSI